jgi:serine-type D-Ala-D-Ala carboxypeptidase (penicillin-binding protein 5/6)
VYDSDRYHMWNLAKIQRFISIILVSVLALGMLLAMRPLPVVTATTQLPVHRAEAASLIWPSYGQAAIGAQGYGLLASNGQQKSVPMASITKLVTALTVLSVKPLKTDEVGPFITFSERDAAFYPSYLARNGSVFPVAVGQRLSQYQVMQAMLIPSANNMADSLALWAFGSMENYLTAANAYLKEQGLNMTSVADASGFSVRSVSSTTDLVKLGIIALQNPVVADIVSQAQAELPGATVFSTNRLLGQSGIVGIKTGNTDEAGGCYLFAVKHTVAGKQITIVGAVLGAPSLYQALIDSRQLAKSAAAGFTVIMPVTKNQVVGIYPTPWGEQAEVIAKENLNLIVWRGSDIKPEIKLKNLKGPQSAGTTVGVLGMSAGPETSRVELILKNDLKPPSPAWRVLR